MKFIRFYKDYKMQELFKSLASANSKDTVEQYGNLLFVGILAPIMFIAGLFCIFLGFYWQIPVLIVVLQVLTLLIASEAIMAMTYLRLNEHKKRHWISLIISIALTATYFLYYDYLNILFWIIFVIILLPTILNTSRITFFYLTVVAAFVSLLSFFKFASLTVRFDLGFITTFSLMLIFITVEIYLLNLVYQFVIVHKSDQVRNLTQQKEEITGLYEEIVASEEELLEKNEQLHKYNLQIQKNHTELEYLAHNDVLTDLPNRTMIQKQLHQLAQTGSEQAAFSFVYIDIDNFKRINDSLGHSIGDKLLIEVGQRFRQKIDPADTLGRLGGDEFAIVIPRAVSAEDLLHYLQELSQHICLRYVINHYELNITASFGVATWPLDAADSENLLQAADTAMNKAKEIGKNVIYFYQQELKEQIVKRIEMENDLAKALEYNELFLEYQPIIDTKTKKIHSFEALLRWQSDKYGRVSPLTFIPLAEDLGIIHPIGNWVIRQACHKINDLNRHTSQAVLIGVNVSTLQMKRSDFIQDVRQILANTKANPAQLKFELTESVFIDDIIETKQMICQLKELGILISIDDFGTGYSSLKYLMELPIDTLKIDKSFTEQITKTPQNKNIVSGIIAIAHNLNMTVVAEGVETKAELEYLESKDCDTIQGYYYSRPLPESEMYQFL